MDTRHAIGIARVICILGIVYVHAWTGRTAEQLLALSSSYQGITRWALIEFVGRSSVPLLGAVSGWLAGPSAARRGYVGFVRTKARTILAPMLAWNVIGMALVCGFATWGSLQAPVPGSVREALDWGLCLSQPNPINVQISFLRDLFVCMLMAPLLARLPLGWLGAVLLVAAAWTLSGVQLYLLLRPQILVFFLLGLLARRAGAAERIAAWPLLPCVAPYLLLTLPKLVLAILDERWVNQHVVLANLLDLPLRVAAAVAWWRIACALSRRPAARTILRGERYIFLLFCDHLALLWLLGPAVGATLTGPLGAPLYLPFLLLQPALSLLFSVALGHALERAAPAAARLLSGGRLAAPLPPRAASVMERATATATASGSAHR